MGETPVDGEMEITEWEPPHAVAASIRDGDVRTLGRPRWRRGPARTFLTISADMPWLDDPAGGLHPRHDGTKRRQHEADDGDRALAGNL